MLEGVGVGWRDCVKYCKSVLYVVHIDSILDECCLVTFVVLLLSVVHLAVVTFIWSSNSPLCTCRYCGPVLLFLVYPIDGIVVLYW